MEIEVDFVGLGAGGEDHGLEEGGGGKVGFVGEEAAGSEGEVGEEAVEGAELLRGEWEVRDGGLL